MDGYILMSSTIHSLTSTLSEPLRCRLLAVLEEQELTVSELCTVLQIPQSTISRHLKHLADHGWVTSRRGGTSHYYQLPREGLQPVAHELWKIVREELAPRERAEGRRRLASVLTDRALRSQDFFDSSAKDWDLVRDDLFGHRFDLSAFLGLLDSRWIVGDLGCGTGRVSELIAPFVKEVVAVDRSTAMLSAARGRLAKEGNIRFRESHLEDLPLEDSALDMAILVLALSFAPAPPAVLREVRRVLKPSGKILLVDLLPHPHEEYRRDLGHVGLGFSPETITQFLENAGFTSSRCMPLRADPLAKGPTLFVASATAELSIYPAEITSASTVRSATL